MLDKVDELKQRSEDIKREAVSSQMGAWQGPTPTVAGGLHADCGEQPSERPSLLKNGCTCLRRVSVPSL